MIGKIIRWCINNSKIVYVISILLGLWGFYCLKNIKIDAIPDLSETQVIIFTEWMGRSPDLIEDQITYPLVTSMLSAPKVKVVRGQSMFGMSFVYVIFEDGTDLYWARSRVIEYLSKISGQLPAGVAPSMGPDASGVGWIFQYALVDPSGQHDLSQIKTFQDWYLRYWLASVPGVAEVASIGGFEKQYQVEVDPNKMSSLKVSIGKVISAIKDNNKDVGGRTIEISEKEHYVRGLGYIKNPREIEDISLGIGPNGTPIRIADIGKVNIGPNIRRGVTDLDGKGDTVGGVIVMRQGEDVSKVIAGVKKKLAEVKGAFPPGLELKIIYDRSNLIKEAVDTLWNNLFEEIILVCIVMYIFLLHFRSTLVVVISLVLSLLIAIIPLYYMGISLNIMSLGGFILAIGDIVDGGIILVENAHKKISENKGVINLKEVAYDACRELGPGLFSAILVIAISFLPIFTLEAQEGKLFHPLAFSKTFVMIITALVTITLVPPLIATFLKGRIRTEHENPVQRKLMSWYQPILKWSLNHARAVLSVSLGLVLLSGFAFTRLGSEFMPSLWEGDLLYMPITVPGISVTTATDILTRQGEAIKKIPEVETVFGKAGRYETPTDPAPLSMFEYTVKLKPRTLWRKGLDQDELLAELDSAVAVPGMNRAWTKPIRGRTDMLSTGIRTPVGIKIFGKDINVIEEIGQKLEATLTKVKGTRSVYAERIAGGYYLDYEPDRKALQRYGLNVGDAQMVVETAIGGMEISQTVEGRERYTISVRYPRELRDDVEKLSRILVTSPLGVQVPLGQLGKISTRMGPPMILDENGSLAGYVYIDLLDRDPGGYVTDAKIAVERELKLPPGYFITWTGQYEYLERMQAKMKVVLPITIFLIFGFLYMSMRSVSKTLMTMVSLPLAAVGSILFIWALGYNMSVAIWVGIIALMGVAVQDTMVMVVFLDEAWEKRKAAGELNNSQDCFLATTDGALKSLRSIVMDLLTDFIGLLPVMLALGLGADVMKRLSAPMFGGLFLLMFFILIVIPVIYLLYEKRVLMKDKNLGTNNG